MSLLIATPCYAGQSLQPFEASCYNLKKELAGTNFPHDFLRISNESLITRARNVISASFLNDTSFDCLLFIDSDIEFTPADVARLWNLCYTGAAVAVGHYRHKNPDAKDQVWVEHELRHVEEFTEPFEVSYAGTGFMMIPRETFLRLKEANPKWRYEEGFPDEKRADTPIKECWAFFQDPIATVESGEGGKFHLSEDYFFCREVRKLGMKVVMDPEVRLKHWGFYPY